MLEEDFFYITGVRVREQTLIYFIYITLTALAKAIVTGLVGSIALV